LSNINFVHQLIFHNDRLIEAARARLPAVSPLSLYGHGVFTSVAIYHARPFLWRAHWERLCEHAARIGLNLDGPGEEDVSRALGQVIEANKVERGRARVMLMQSDATLGFWKMKEAKSEEKTSRVELLILTGDARPVPEEGLALTVSPHRINTFSPLAGLKSINYLEHLLAWEEARARQFDEAVMLNERGEIVSATMANIFWVSDGVLHTPALTTSCLRGTTRSCVLELAADLSVPVVESTSDLSRLGDAEEIFLTSSGLGVGIVTTFDFHRYSVPVGSVALRLREAFRQLTLRDA
jgi:branched-chain amino acid aminotransferase